MYHGKKFLRQGQYLQDADADEDLSLKKVIPYTTRPMRAGEREGVEYFFCSEEQLAAFEEAGKVIELRAYQTVHGIWKYFTVNDHQVADVKQDYLLIGTLESYLKIRDYFGRERVVPIYVEVEDGERLMRAIERERMQGQPKYEEMCRRFLADSADFSEEKLKSAQIEIRFVNRDLIETVQNIKKFYAKINLR